MTNNNRSTPIATPSAAGSTGHADPLALIALAATRGRQFTDVRNALIAHALAGGTKQSAIVAGSGVDKGDVSRIAKVVAEWSPRKVSAFRASIVLADVALDDMQAVAALSTKGQAFRRVKSAPANKGTTNAATGESESTDMRALVHDFIVNAPDSAAALALIAEAVEAARTTLAEQAAAQDMAA